MRNINLLAFLALLAAWFGSYDSSHAQTCRGRQTLTAPSGVFDDGSGRRQYGNNLSCEWLIQPPGASFLRLEFQQFLTEFQMDYVIVFDGPTPDSPVLAELSGEAKAEPIFTTQGSALVLFVTNEAATDEGWTLRYESVEDRPSCSGQQPLFEMAGAFEDGSGPEDYSDNLDCEWLAFNPFGGVGTIRLEFDSFSTETDKDVVEIYNGFDRSGPLVGSYSGNKLPEALEFEASAALVVFRTNEATGDAGWSVKYEWIQPEPTCSGQTTHTEPSGVFDDGSGPEKPYAGNLNCEWLIQPDNANFIRIDFEEFSLGMDGLVTVFDGLDPEAEPIGTFGGFVGPPTGPIFTTQGTARVVFQAFMGGGDGWTLRYQSVNERPSCNGRQSFFDLQGAIEDGSGDADYSHDLACEWQLINPQWTPGTIRLQFDRFSTEAENDVVEIYNGFDASSTLMASYSGSELPEMLEFQASSALVVFRTNGSVASAGWRLNYEWVQPPATCEGRAELTEASGVFEDGSGPGTPYTGNLNCEWLVQPTEAAQYLRLDFEEFKLDFNAMVYIFDGPNRESELLGAYQAGDTPSAVFTSQGSALVVFEGFGMGTAEGWTLRYESVNERPSCSGRRVVSDFQGTIEDGSGDANYSDNLDCEWLLVHPGGEAAPLRLQFEALATELVLDFITIYEGYDRNGRLLGVFTGTRIPRALELETDAVFIVFSTNGSRSNAGWTLRYEWPLPSAGCEGRVAYEDQQGMIEDGSGWSGAYAANLECEWLIQPVGASGLEIWFEMFDTHSEADYVAIYEGDEAREDRLLLRHSGRSLPPSLSVPSGTALVRFVTDETGTGDGWALNYNAAGTSRPAKVNAPALTIYPNPAAQSCTLSASAAQPQAATLTVTDVTGRVIESRNLMLEAGTNALTLDVAEWPAGVYGVRIQTAEGQATARLLKP